MRTIGDILGLIIGLAGLALVPFGRDVDRSQDLRPTPALVTA